MNNSTLKQKTVRLCRLALLFCLAIALSSAENMLTPSGLIAGVKLGLSNIVTMYCLFCVGIPEAIILVVLKSAFVFLTRGVTAGLLSLSGGIFSALVMILLLLLFKEKISMFLLSIFGGIVHNIAQLTVACILTDSFYIFYYFPVLLISGTAAGIITGLILKTVMPILNRLNL